MYLSAFVCFLAASDMPIRSDNKFYLVETGRLLAIVSVSLSEELVVFSPSSGIDPARSEKTTFFFLRDPPPPEPVQLFDKDTWRTLSIECERSRRRSSLFGLQSVMMNDTSSSD